MVWQAPAELLGHLVAQRLAALGVVGAHVDVHKRPPVVVVVGQLATQPVHLVVGAVNGHQRRPVDGGPDNLAALQVRRDKHHGAHPGAGGVGCHAACQVASGGAGNGLEPEFLGLGSRHGNHAVLERKRRVHAVVLDVQVVEPQPLAQVVCLEQRRVARHDVHGIIALGGQQVGVPPDAQRPGLDPVPAHHFGDGGVVVDHLQRAEAEITDIKGIGGLFPPALAAFESINESHCPRFLPSGGKPE